MALITLLDAKTYLRVDSSDEDALIGILLSSASFVWMWQGCLPGSGR